MDRLQPGAVSADSGLSRRFADVPDDSALRGALLNERGEWDRVSCEGLSRGQIKGAFLGAVEWADQVDSELKALSVP